MQGDKVMFTKYPSLRSRQKEAKAALILNIVNGLVFTVILIYLIIRG